jgi:glutathione S-transferase
MIIVHHLDDSRSQRIFWLLEELGVPYQIKQHMRDPQTRLAPPALKQFIRSANRRSLKTTVT